MYETEIIAGVLRFSRPDTRWLSTGWNGGFCDADAAFNVTVPTDFERTALEAYAQERRTAAGFDTPGATLFTGVELQHARGATCGPVTCVATAGLSNPATLPLESACTGEPSAPGRPDGPRDARGPGTVNLLLGTDRALDEGTLASLCATVVEAKTATLLGRTGFTGTTTDAVVVGSDPSGVETPFAGSGTTLGRAARACVRDAVSASLQARYEDVEIPASVDAAEYGAKTDAVATTFDPNDGGT